MIAINKKKAKELKLSFDAPLTNCSDYLNMTEEECNGYRNCMECFKDKADEHVALIETVGRIHCLDPTLVLNELGRTEDDCCDIDSCEECHKALFKLLKQSFKTDFEELRKKRCIVKEK